MDSVPQQYEGEVAPGSVELKTEEIVIIVVALVLVLVALIVFTVKCFEFQQTRKKRDMKRRLRRQKKKDESNNTTNGEAGGDPTYAFINRGMALPMVVTSATNGPAPVPSQGVMTQAPVAVQAMPQPVLPQQMVQAQMAPQQNNVILPQPIPAPQPVMPAPTVQPVPQMVAQPVVQPVAPPVAPPVVQPVQQPVMQPAPQVQQVSVVDATQKTMNLPANGNVLIDGQPYTITSATVVPSSNNNGVSAIMGSQNLAPAVPAPVVQAPTVPAPIPQVMNNPQPVQQVAVVAPVSNGIYSALPVVNPQPQPQPQPQPPPQLPPPSPPPVQQREVLLNPIASDPSPVKQMFITSSEQPQQQQSIIYQVPVTSQSPPPTYAMQSTLQPILKQVQEPTEQVPQVQVTQVQVRNSPLPAITAPSDNEDDDLPPTTTVPISDTETDPDFDSEPVAYATYGPTEILQPDPPAIATYDPAHTEFAQKAHMFRKPRSILVRNGSGRRSNGRKNSLKRAPRQLNGYKQTASRGMPSRSVRMDSNVTFISRPTPTVTYISPTAAAAAPITYSRRPNQQVAYTLQQQRLDVPASGRIMKPRPIVRW